MIHFSIPLFFKIQFLTFFGILQQNSLQISNPLAIYHLQFVSSAI